MPRAGALMVSQAVIAAVVTVLGTAVIAVLGWAFAAIRRELSESNEQRQEEHRWMRDMVVQNFKSHRELRQALNDANDLSEVELPAPDTHPLEERSTRDIDAD